MAPRKASSSTKSKAAAPAAPAPDAKAPRGKARQVATKDEPKTTTSSKPTKAAASSTKASKSSKTAHVANGVPTPPASTISVTKRKAASTEADAAKTVNGRPQAKRQRVASGRSTAAEPAKPVAINQPPTDVLTVLVFGTGECGELGLGPKLKETVRPRQNPFLDPSGDKSFRVVTLDCGGMHTVALTDSNRLLTWGVNDNGALGRDTAWDGGLRDADAGSDSDSESADLNPREATPAEIPTEHFPADTKFVQVAAGDSCSFALTETGQVYGWGTFIDSEGKKRWRYHNGKLLEVQATPALVPELSSIKQIACGANHALALDASGNVWAWGVGEQNQLGRRVMPRHQKETLNPHRVEVCRNDARYIASGLYHSFAIDGKDNVWAWGLNSYGEAGHAELAGGSTSVLPHPMKIPGLSGKKILAIAGGAHHSVAATAEGEFLAWGRIDGGQLGIRFSEEQLSNEELIRRDEYNKPRICLQPTAVPNVGKAAWVSCGTDHTIFVDAEGKAYGAGFGTMGQLGLGNSDDTDTAEEITGKHVKGKKLTWAGAGGQFSAVAGPASLANGA